MATFFSDYFGISADTVSDYGAFNVSLVNDLPLFIDPFLLFNSDKPEYVALHSAMIDYLIFLKQKAAAGEMSDGLLRGWYCFPEVRQNWLGFSISGNGGSGLGINFARALHSNLYLLFPDFGSEQITEGSHLEKVCLIAEGVGRDNISDFTTNLITGFFCEYTQTFARAHLKPEHCRQVSVPHVRFNYETETWTPATFTLPWADGDFVLLTPKDMLTRDENWINRHDLIRGFEEIPIAITDSSLREQVANYFYKVLARPREREPNAKERGLAATLTLLQFPQLVDYYIRLKEQRGDEATDISAEKVFATEQFFIAQLQELQAALASLSNYYGVPATTHAEAHVRLAYLKDIIENKGGQRIFYLKGKPVEREEDLQVLYRLVWFGSPSDVGREANDGRGPVDFKITRGAKGKTLVEMKLASNRKLEQNLANQTPVYQRASDAKWAIKVIVYFSQEQLVRVKAILKKLRMDNDPDVVLIDARADNKPSGSVAKG